MNLLEHNQEVVENRKLDFSIIVLFYSILFLPKIGLLDLKSIVLFGFFLTGLKKNSKIFLDKRIKLFVVSLVILCVLFVINSFIYQASIYILLRYVRALYSVFCLCTYLGSKNISNQSMIKSMLFVLLLHAGAIYLSMFIPQTKQFIYLLSGYHRKELPLRASGLVSGYDFAGFYLVVGSILSIFYNLHYKNKVFSFTTILLIVATVFTSRFNIVVLCMVLGVTILYMLRTGRIKSFAAIFIIIPVLAVGLVFSILTFDIFSDLKISLMAKYSWITALDSTINNSYSSNNLKADIGDQFFLDPNINLFTGMAKEAGTDPGYINTIFESGLLGLLITMFPYLSTISFGVKNRKISIYHQMVMALGILILLYNVKLIFCFASGITELMFIFLLEAIYQGNQEIVGYEVVDYE